MAAGDGWRYIAQRFDGSTGSFGEFIDLNVPLTNVTIEDVLSGHNAMSGTITPEYPRLKGPDGQPILVEGGTAIWAESPDGEIRGGGLLERSGFGDGGQWEIECVAITATSVGLPFTDATFFVNVDPTDLFRYIWTWIQQQRNHNLGITIDGTTSPIRLGTDLVQRVEFDTEEDVSEDLEPADAPIAPSRYPNNGAWRDASIKALKALSWNPKDVEDALRKWLNKDTLTAEKKWTPLTEKERKIRDRAIDMAGWPPNPPNPGPRDISKIGLIYVRPQINPPVGGEDTTTEEPEPTPGATYEYDAYKLNWYEDLDLGATLDDLAANTPFDWHLTSRWDANDEIRHHIRLGYPRIGRRRDDLRFVVGENIRTVPAMERDRTEYADEVLVLGAGEGSSMIRGMAFRPNSNRVRKVAVISDPNLKTVAEANQRAELEVSKRSKLEHITEIVLSDHPHAPLGSVDLGDEILVEGDIGWVEFSIWCRVIARAMSPDDGDSQVLTILRSDAIA